MYEYYLKICPNSDGDSKSIGIVQSFLKQDCVLSQF